MMRRLATVASVVVATAVSAASAQPDGRPSGAAAPPARGSGLVLRLVPVPKQMLIRDSAVAEELKLSPSQRAKMAELLRQFQQQGAELRERIRRDRPPDEPPNPERLQQEASIYVEARDEQERAADAAMEATLDRVQRSRFAQLHLQAEGPVAFDRPEVCTRLNLAPEQVESIRQIVQEARRQNGPAVMAIFRGPAPAKADPQESRRRMEEVWSNSRKATSREILRILTKGQRARYKTMLGEPFDFSRPAGPARGSADGDNTP